MDISIIRTLAEKRSGGLKKLAADIGMSEANMHACINKNKMQAGDLENVAKCLEVDIRIFFDLTSDSSDKLLSDKNGQLLQLCKELVHNFQQRDEMMTQLVLMVKQME